MRIVVYGGSFNPPHVGHLRVAEAAARQLEPDRFLIVPARIPPHKKLPENSPGPEERFELCRLCFSETPKAEIDDREIRREGPSYTADTIAELKEEFPGAEIDLLLGTDMLLCIDSWYRFSYLLENCVLTVFPRGEGEAELICEKADRLRREHRAKLRMLELEAVPTSSEEIRLLLPERKGRELLTDSVYGEIIRRRWYRASPDLDWLREKAVAQLKPKRVPHVLGCESEAVRLAERWGADASLAAEAALLHDITKKGGEEAQFDLCRKYKLKTDAGELESPNILHARTGAEYARRVFGVDDRVYGAIRWHCTGKPNMTLLEKIVWMADYIEPTRDFPGVEEVRSLAYDDLDAAMTAALKTTLAHIREDGKKPYKDTVKAYQWFCSREEN